MPKKVAAVVTEYRRWSRADVILRNLLGGYPDGTKPDLELVALYTDQVPKGDMSRTLEKKHGFKIFPTVADCLTLGGKSLAVDAVLYLDQPSAKVNSVVAAHAERHEVRHVRATAVIPVLDVMNVAE